MRNESQTAAPATSPAAPSSAKMPAPTMAPTPMKAACRTDNRAGWALAVMVLTTPAPVSAASAVTDEQRRRQRRNGGPAKTERPARAGPPPYLLARPWGHCEVRGMSPSSVGPPFDQFLATADAVARARPEVDLEMARE